MLTVFPKLVRRPTLLKIFLLRFLLANYEETLILLFLLFVLEVEAAEEEVEAVADRSAVTTSDSVLVRSTVLLLWCHTKHFFHHEFASFIIEIALFDIVVELPLEEDCIITLLFTSDVSSFISITVGDVSADVSFSAFLAWTLIAHK